MHNKLEQALKLLEINTISLRDDNGNVVCQVSSREHAEALFTYLDLAGYLSPYLLEKAIKYLSVAKPFVCPNETLISHLKSVYDTAHQSGLFRQRP